MQQKLFDIYVQNNFGERSRIKSVFATNAKEAAAEAKKDFSKPWINKSLKNIPAEICSKIFSEWIAVEREGQIENARDTVQAL